MAHRIIYRLQVGPIEDGIHLHHRETCKKCCVNPEHLTPLTHSEHSVVTSRAKVKATHCKRGHEFIPENITMYGGVRQCKVCLMNRRRELRLERPPKPGRQPVACCVAGHEYTPENTYLQTDGKGNVRRSCKICRTVGAREYRRRNRSLVTARDRVRDKARRGITTFTALEMASGSKYLHGQTLTTKETEKSQ